MTKNIVAIGAMFFASFQLAAAAVDDIRLGIPSYNGNGCPTGSAAAALSTDFKALSILFDQFTVNVGGTTARQADRRSCNIAVPVHVPQGMSVSVFKIDYRGFNSLPARAYAMFNVEYFFAGSRGPLYTKIFNNPEAAPYLLTNELMGEAVVWSECGEEVIVRANTSMYVKTNAELEEAMSTVDSMDVNGGLTYHLQWKTCTKRPTR